MDVGSRLGLAAFFATIYSSVCDSVLQVVDILLDDYLQYSVLITIFVTVFWEILSSRHKGHIKERILSRNVSYVILPLESRQFQLTQDNKHRRSHLYRCGLLACIE